MQKRRRTDTLRDEYERIITADPSFRTITVDKAKRYVASYEARIAALAEVRNGQEMAKGQDRWSQGRAVQHRGSSLLAGAASPTVYDLFRRTVRDTLAATVRAMRVRR